MIPYYYNLALNPTSTDEWLPPTVGPDFLSFWKLKEDSPWLKKRRDRAIRINGRLYNSRPSIPASDILQSSVPEYPPPEYPAPPPPPPPPPPDTVNSGQANLAAHLQGEDVQTIPVGEDDVEADEEDIPPPLPPRNAPMVVPLPAAPSAPMVAPPPPPPPPPAPPAPCAPPAGPSACPAAPPRGN